MKTRNLSWIVAVIAGSIALGQEAPPAFEKSANEGAGQVARGNDLFDHALNAPKVLRIRVEHIELDHKQLTKLLMDDKPVSTDATGLRMKVQELADKEVAKVMETQVVLSRSGQKATVESIQEVIYPTEYEPPGQDLDPQGKEMRPRHANNPAVPTSFETRNLGSSLEVEPTISSDDRIIDIRIVSQMTWHTGNRVWYEGKDTAGNPFKVTTPDFYLTRFNTSFNCIDGQYFMAGVASPKNTKGELDNDRKVMVFVKCDILPTVP